LNLQAHAYYYDVALCYYYFATKLRSKLLCHASKIMYTFFTRTVFCLFPSPPTFSVFVLLFFALMFFVRTCLRLVCVCVEACRKSVSLYRSRFADSIPRLSSPSLFVPVTVGAVVSPNRFSCRRLMQEGWRFSLL